MERAEFFAQRPSNIDKSVFVSTYLSDANSRNVFDIEKFLSTQLRPKPEETYAAYEIDVDGEEYEDADGEEHIPPFIPDI